MDCYIEALVENADYGIPQGICTLVLYETSIFCGVLSHCGSRTFTMQSRGNCVIWNQQHKGYKCKPTTYELSNCDGFLNLSDFKLLLITKLGLLEMTGDCTQDLT